MAKLLVGRGWMAYVLTAAKYGYFPDGKIDWEKKQEEWSSYAPEKPIEMVQETLSVLAGSGFARLSRKGWHVMDHPDVGQISWKQGVDFRTVKPYFFLRINGKEVVKIWPKPGC